MFKVVVYAKIYSFYCIRYKLFFHKTKFVFENLFTGLSSDGTSLGIPVNSRRKRDLVLDEKMIQSLIKKKRKKRQAGTKNVVELLMLTDFSEYD